MYYLNHVDPSLKFGVNRENKTVLDVWNDQFDSGIELSLKLLPTCAMLKYLFQDKTLDCISKKVFFAGMPFEFEDEYANFDMYDYRFNGFIDSLASVGYEDWLDGTSLW